MFGKPLSSSATLFSISVLMLSTVACASMQPGTPPGISRWESRMTDYGEKYCREIQDGTTSGEKKLADTYYDAERIYYLIADYTGDRRWMACAQAAEQAYRDGYLFRHNGKLPGFWVFPHGLLMDYQRTQDVRSKEALLLMAQNAAFANVGGYPEEWVVGAESSREVAYNLQLKLLAREVGAPYGEHVTYFANLALGHIDQWFISGTAKYIQPFMVGLTAEALIAYHARTSDPRVLPAIRTAMDRLWDQLWIPREEAFLYIDRPVESAGGQGAIQPAPDLNLLIAPAFAWLYMQTGDAKYMERGDQIFYGGARLAAVDFGAKQFNQNYRWSFDYLKWRKEAEEARATKAAKQPPGKQAAQN
jgi:hypothetical protein